VAFSSTSSFIARSTSDCLSLSKNSTTGASPLDFGLSLFTFYLSFYCDYLIILLFQDFFGFEGSKLYWGTFV